MIIEKHALVTEFPELKAQIHTLKLSDAHFARLFTEYHELDHQVIRAEEGVEHLSDSALESLKLRRAQLKDNLYRQAKHSQQGCCGSCGGNG